MSGAWTPADAPPRLDRFCHLSLDAQRVMAALYTDFHQRKAEMTAAMAHTPGIADPQNYYRAIYEAKFGKTVEDSYEQAQRSCMNTTSTPTSLIPAHYSNLATSSNGVSTERSSKYFQQDMMHKPARQLIFSECPSTSSARYQNGRPTMNTNTCASASVFPEFNNQPSAPAVAQLSPDTSNYSDSPPVETQDFRILTQMNRQEGYSVSNPSTSDSPKLDTASNGAYDIPNTSTEDTEDNSSLKSKDGTAMAKNCEGKAPHTSEPSKSDFGIPKKSSANPYVDTSEYNCLPAQCKGEFNDFDSQIANICNESDLSRCLFSQDMNIASNNVVKRMANKQPHQTKQIQQSIKTLDSALVHSYLDNTNLNLDYDYEVVEYPKFEILSDDGFSFSPVCTGKSSANKQQDNTDTVYVKALDGLFNQNSTVYTNGNSNRISNEKEKNSKNMLDIEQHYLKLCMNGESPFVNEECRPASISRRETNAKKLPGVFDQTLTEMQTLNTSCNKSKTNLNPRGHKNSNVSRECESPFVNKEIPVYPVFQKRSHPSSAESAKRKTSDNTKFVVPRKKSKVDTSSDDAYSTSEIQPRNKKAIVNIDDESRETVSSIMHDILNASKVVISLVYKDRTTQLRDNLFGQDSKKKVNASKKKVSDVEYFAVSPMGCSGNQVFTFTAEFSNQQMLDSCREFWCSLLSSKSVGKIGFQAKDFLKEILRLFRVDQYEDWLVLDASVAWWLLEPDKPVSSFHHLISSLSMPQQAPNDSSLSALPGDMAQLNAAMDKIKQKLESRELYPLFINIESKLIPVLSAMELRPLTVATHTLLHFSEILKSQMSDLEKQAHKAAGRPVLLSSHAQLRQVLFEELKLDTKLPGNAKLAKTSVGRETSTSEAVLTQLLPFHPLPAIVSEHRQLQKLKSTYIDGMLSCVSDGCLYTHWDQTAACTGRVTSYQPNIQAIPKVPVTITTTLATIIPDKPKNETLDIIYARDAFTSRAGYTLIAADFQQIELRLLGHLSNDEALIRLFSDPDIPDVFNALTAQWLGKPAEVVSSSEREQTKRVVYSIMYGVGKEKLAEYLKISVENAKAIMASFLVKFPAVGHFTKSCVEFCHKNGYTLSILKRRRLFPNIHHSNYSLRAQTERQCVNFCVQGSAADICKVAMLGVEAVLRTNSHLDARLLIQIHDELLLEVADNHVLKVIGLVKSVMEEREFLASFGVWLKIPIPVSISTGKKWGHMAPVEPGTSESG